MKSNELAVGFGDAISVTFAPGVVGKQFSILRAHDESKLRGSLKTLGHQGTLDGGNAWVLAVED